jgi:hypothetical protein
VKVIISFLSACKKIYWEKLCHLKLIIDFFKEMYCMIFSFTERHIFTFHKHKNKYCTVYGATMYCTLQSYERSCGKFNSPGQLTVYASNTEKRKSKNSIFKGTLIRDFLPLIFFYQTTPPRPLILGLKPF